MSSHNTSFGSQFNRAEESLGFLLWKTSNQLQRAHQQVLSPLGLSNGEFSVLACVAELERFDGPPNQNDLAQKAGMDKMQVSDTLKRLLKKGWVQKDRCLEDRRSFLVSATAEGRSVLTQSIVKVEQVDQEFFACLQSPEQLSVQLVRLVSRSERL